MNGSTSPERHPGAAPRPERVARRRSSRLAGAAVAALTVTGLLAGCGHDTNDDTSTGEASGFTGIERDQAPDVSDVALPDAAAGGEAFPFTAPDGGLLLVYFGYTNCPDVCPTTMADVRTALGDLPASEAERVEVAVVTIDPAQDTADVLTAYAQSFVPDAHALRTEDDATLRAVADTFGANYQVTRTADGEVEVGHTDHLYAVDDQGRLRLQWPFPTPPEDLRHDLELLLDQQASAA